MKRITKILGFVFVFTLLFIFNACATNYEDILDKAYNSLDIPSFTKENLDFPNEIRIDSHIVDAEFKTSNPEVISEYGVITRGNENVNVTISVELTYKSVSKNYVISEITVLKLEVFTIKYNLDGGECDELPSSYLENSDLVLPTPTKFGYRFLGWYDGEELVTKLGAKNYNLVAKWEYVYHKLTFNLDGGTCDNLPDAYYEEPDFVLPVPVKDGYTFLGWYENGVLITKLENKDYNLVAVWIKNVYTIVYNCDGGEFEDGVNVIYFTDDDIISLKTPTKKGYAFVGWFENDNQITDPIEYKNYNLKAIWIEKNFTITYDLDGGVCENLFYSFNDNALELPIPTKEGMAFLGWYEGNNLISKLEYKDYNLVAKWSKNEALTILMDTNVCEIGKDALFSIKDVKEKEYKDYNWIISNEELMTLDEDYIGKFLQSGEVTLTVIKKDNENIRGSITFTIKSQTPKINLSVATVYVDLRFDLLIENYNNDLSLFNVNIGNTSVVKFEDNRFYASSRGTTNITLSLINDPTVSGSITVTVYSILPELEILNTDMIVGNRSKLKVLNYERSMYKIESSDISILEILDDNIIAMAEGTTTIKVSLISNPNYYSTITIRVYPITPELKLGTSNLLVGGQTRLMVTNLGQLQSDDLNDYDVIVSSELVATVDEKFMITAHSEGSVLIKVTHKTNPLITSSIELNVFHTSSKRDENGEIAVGPLFLTISEPSCYIHAGDMDYVIIDGAVNPLNYTYFSSDVTTIAIYDNGRFTAIKEGYSQIIVKNKLNNEVVGSMYIEVYGTPNVNYVERLIKIAEAEIGYKETGDNGTKYGTWYGLPGEAWCAMFVSWCANQAGISTTVIPKYAGCSAGSQWFIERGQFGYKGEYTPKAGDIIFFLSDGASHTGIVIGCDGSTVYTIEGNTSNMVAKRSYPLNKSTITGYGIPNYPAYDGQGYQGNTEGATDGGGASTK